MDQVATLRSPARKYSPQETTQVSWISESFPPKKTTLS